MVSLLTRPEFQKRTLPLSVKAWHAMIAQGLAPRRAELVRGVILEKISKSILHTKILSRLLRLLQTALGDSFWIRKEDPITLTDSEPEPDVSVVMGREENYDHHPVSAALVVEVAVTTLREDREMVPIYAEAQVAECWIVDVAGKGIEVYREPVGSSYAVTERIGAGGVLRCASLPGVVVDVDALFVGLPSVTETVKPD